MTDQTPENRDRELELLAERDRINDLAAGHERDLAAILIVRPHLRPTILDALAADGTLPAVAGHVLTWLDELLLPREADELHTALELQAQVALATTREGLADLT